MTRNFLLVLFLVLGLFGLYLLIAGLLSLPNGGVVNMPLLGRQAGGFFLIIVSLIISVGCFAGFFRIKRR